MSLICVFLVKYNVNNTLELLTWLERDRDKNSIPETENSLFRFSFILWKIANRR